MCDIAINNIEKYIPFRKLSKKTPAKVAIEKAKAEIIFKIVCEMTGIDSSEIVKKCNKRELVQARRIGMYLTHYHTNLSDVQNSAMYGRKHCDVFYGNIGVENLLQTDFRFSAMFKEIKNECLKKLNENKNNSNEKIS